MCDTCAADHVVNILFHTVSNQKLEGMVLPMKFMTAFMDKFTTCVGLDGVHSYCNQHSSNHCTQYSLHSRTAALQTPPTLPTESAHAAQWADSAHFVMSYMKKQPNFHA